MEHTNGKLHTHDDIIHLEDKDESGNIIEHLCIGNTNPALNRELRRWWANRICHAVNHFDELLEACKETKILLDYIAQNYKGAPHFPKVERMVEQAIQNAEQK